MQINGEQIYGFTDQCSAMFSSAEAVESGYWLSQMPNVLEQVLEEVRSLRHELKAFPATTQPITSYEKDGWLDSKDAASYLGMSKNTFEKHRYKATNTIKAYMVGGKNFFKRSDLDRWVMTWKDRSDGYF
jgi:excisionase family DNA binding protein